MFDWLQGLSTTLTQWLEQGNPPVYAVLFLVSAVIEVGVPVPWVQDTVLLYVGYEPSGRLLPMAPLVMATLLAGRIVGASVVFWVARLLGPKFLAWLGRKSPRILARSQDLGARLGKRSWMAVTIARLTPGLLTPSTVAAGIFRISYLQFCTGLVLSSILPDVGEVVSGLAIRAGFTVAGITPSPTLFIVGLVVVMGLVWLGNWLWGRRRKSRKKSPPR